MKDTLHLCVMIGFSFTSQVPGPGSVCKKYYTVLNSNASFIFKTDYYTNKPSPIIDSHSYCGNCSYNVHSFPSSRMVADLKTEEWCLLGCYAMWLF
jgi:hypothetical protein